jgi:protein-S-isoprenylcysteine O-methyltransferase Ste14
VRLYEEPVLTDRYGEQYARYRRSVPGWIPQRPRQP